MIITYQLLDGMFPGLVLSLLGFAVFVDGEVPIIRSRFTFSQLFHF